MGLDFNKTLQLGIGYNILYPSPERKVFVQSNTGIDTTVATLQYHYLSPFLQYTFYKDKHWVFTIPVQLGFGYAWYASPNNNWFRSAIVSYEPGITAEYKPIPYFGIGTGIGYRFAFVNEMRKRESFTAPVWMIFTKIYFGKLYRDIFPAKTDSKAK